MSGSASEDQPVTVAWAFGDEPELTARLIQEATASGGPPSPGWRLTHLCPACSSTEHGRPVLSAEGEPGRGPFVSLSRAGRLTVVAVCELGPVGVDVEADEAADFPGFDRVALHPGEHSTTGNTVVWVRKESVLKATGHGLRVEPSHVWVSAPDEAAALVEWNGPGGLPTTWMYDVTTAPGHVAAVTVLAARRPALVVRAAREAPAPRATA